MGLWETWITWTHDYFNRFSIVTSGNTFVNLAHRQLLCLGKTDQRYSGLGTSSPKRFRWRVTSGSVFQGKISGELLQVSSPGVWGSKNFSTWGGNVCGPWQVTLRGCGVGEGGMVMEWNVDIHLDNPGYVKARWNSGQRWKTCNYICCIKEGHANRGNAMVAFWT